MPDHVHVGGRADKGKRNRVYAVLEAKLEIFAVFFGQSRNRQSGTRQVDALMLAQSATIQDVADYVFATDSAHSQFDEAIAQENARSNANFAGEIREGGGNTSGRAGNITRSNDHG